LQNSHIAFWLLLVFTGSFMPFNIWHHHAEDDHIAATHFHIDEESHNCALDEQICQAQFENHCEHKTHLAKSVSKCFTCDFHFIKHVEHNNIKQNYILNAIVVLCSNFADNTLADALILLSNKGPPILVV